MAHWQPSTKTLLTLKQLGFDPGQIRHTLGQYRLEHDHPDDLGFMQYLVAAPGLTPEHQQQLADRAQLPLVWRPSPHTQNALMKRGCTAEAIAHYAALFVLWAREQRLHLSNSDAAFVTFCEHRPRSLPEPMPDNWMPSGYNLQKILQTVCPDMDYITGQIERFIEHHQYSVASDWDERFAQWIGRGWHSQSVAEVSS